MSMKHKSSVTTLRKRSKHHFFEGHVTSCKAYSWLTPMQLPQYLKIKQFLSSVILTNLMNTMPVHLTASSVQICKSSVYSLHKIQTAEHRQPSQRGQPLTFMLEKVLTDAVNTFWMRTQGNLSLIGNFLVIEEEEEVCVCSCHIIHLQKTKDPPGSLRRSLSNAINRKFLLSQRLNPKGTILGA